MSLSQSSSLAQQLTAHVRPWLADDPEDPKLFHYNGQAYVVKFARPTKPRFWKERGSALATRLFFGYRVRSIALRTLDIHQEVARLQQLRAAGIAVPEVYVHTNDFFIMQACGLSINDLLKEQAEVLIVEEKRKYLRAAVDALIDLHQKKQWHGGAQLRNLTWWEDVVYRIDFEENTGNALPLSIAQAYDVMQCFLTIAPHLKDDTAYGHELFARYLDHYHNPDIVVELRKTTRALHRLTRLGRFLSQKTLQSNDVQATLFFYALLQQGLETK